MAPEQRDTPSQVDNRADIYSLGVVFYELLTGEVPPPTFTRPSEKTGSDPRIDAIVQQAPPSRPRALASAALAEVRGRRWKPSPPARRPADPHLPTVPSPPPPQIIAHFSRLAILGAVWAPLIILPGFLSTACITRPTPTLRSTTWYEQFLPLMLFGLAAPFGTTLLGWIAIAQIRRSAGRVYGLGLAVIDGLLYPLLTLEPDHDVHGLPHCRLCDRSIRRARPWPPWKRGGSGRD